MRQGTCYIAYGSPANNAMRRSIESLKTLDPRMPLAIAGDRRDRWHVPLEARDGYTNVQLSRWAKVNLDRWSPFNLTLYLDADTYVYRDITPGFDMLRDGWDVVIVPSTKQGHDVLWHIDAEEKEATLDLWKCNEILQLQGGLFFFRKSARVRALFAAWRREWKKYEQQDQGALLRALHQRPVKLFLLGFPWNGGVVVGHRHGMARG